MGAFDGIVRAGRRLIAQTYVDVVVRQELATVRDDRGGSRQTWVDVGRRVPCRFGVLNEADSAGRQARPTSGQMEGVAGGVLLCALDTGFREGDRVRDVKLNRVWLIMGEATPPSGMATTRRLYIREI